MAELEKELDKLKLKIQGTLKIGGSGEQKRLIQINTGRLSRFYAKRLRTQALEQKKLDVQHLFNQPLALVDVSYDAAAIKKSFNIHSSEV